MSEFEKGAFQPQCLKCLDSVEKLCRAKIPATISLARPIWRNDRAFRCQSSIHCYSKQRAKYPLSSFSTESLGSARRDRCYFNRLLGAPARLFASSALNPTKCRSFDWEASRARTDGLGLLDGQHGSAYGSGERDRERGGDTEDHYISPAKCDRGDDAPATTSPQFWNETRCIFHCQASSNALRTIAHGSEPNGAGIAVLTTRAASTLIENLIAQA